MKKTRVFINGFGRIGHATLRIMIEEPSIEIVGINDIYDFEQMLQLLAYDSIYGPYNKALYMRENRLIIDDIEIPLYQESNPQHLPVKNVDILLQCTGIFLTKESNQIYLDNGAKKVLISAPGADDIPTYVMDVNHLCYAGERILSNSSCSANAILPIFMGIDKAFHIKSASMSMFHSYTAYQSLLDVKHYSKDIRRSRSATQNIQPLMSSAANECAKFFPHLKGNLYAKSIRVPVSACTLYDLTIHVNTPTNKEALHQLFTKACYNSEQEILEIAQDSAVSSDFIGNGHGAVLDFSLTKVIEGDLLKIFAWQDNEYGYAMQLVRMVKHIS